MKNKKSISFQLNMIAGEGKSISATTTGSKPIKDLEKVYNQNRVIIKTPISLAELMTRGESYLVKKVEMQAGVISPYYLNDLHLEIDSQIDGCRVMIKATANLFKV